MSYTTCERRGWDAPCSELGELEAALAKARRERDEARGDLVVYRAANLTCGQSPTTVSLGMAPTHTQGCGLGIADGKDVFRCRDCEVPFHRSCLNRHCDDELATEREALAEAQRERDALICGITDLLHEISGDDYLATSSLPLPALTAVVRRQVAALAEARRVLEACSRHLGHCLNPRPGVPWPNYDCKTCMSCRVRAALAAEPDGTRGPASHGRG